jgi:hypothetical protein
MTAAMPMKILWALLDILKMSCLPVDYISGSRNAIFPFRREQAKVSGTQ